MILLIGLGNPGKEFANTPHNMGRICVEEFITSHEFEALKFERKFNALVSEGTFSEEKFLVALPETFMNNSGDSVALIAQFYKISPENIWVLHDEADIPLGNVRIAFGASPAGHNGVKSVAEKLGTKDFWRFRIGIAPQEPLVMPLDAYVLKKDVIDDDQTSLIKNKTMRLLETAFQKGIAELKKEAD